MSRITFNIASKCDKAGRSQNQDNYWVCPNLDEIGDSSIISKDADIELSSKGALLVVADGMGGMKSGEKASEFVIEGIKDRFSNIPDAILHDDNAIISFIKNAIVESDQLIKSYAKDHRESEGMGSTIVLLWMLGDKAYCGWCGDSRIYCYNPQNKLVRLSHDHSYVQSLVDEGKITEEEAFDHPDGNIITRSLGDSGEIAHPETKIYPIHRRDVFMLCSDGLCGLLTDEQIEAILADNCTSSEDALKALWSKGEKLGWSDNATIEVACIVDGGSTPTRKAIGYDEGNPKPITPKKGQIKKDTTVAPNFWQKNKQYILLVGIIAVIAIGIICFFSRDKRSGESSNQEFNIDLPDNNNQAGETQQLEQSDNSSNVENPQKPRPPAKPQRPIKPQLPNNGNSGGNTNQQTVGPAQPQQPEIPQPVSQDYLNMLKDTYGSIETIRQFIKNAQSRGHLTSAEANALKDFKANADDLNAQRKGKTMRPEQEQKLNGVNAMARQAGSALSRFKAYDDRIPQPQQPQQSNPPGRGTHHTDPIEGPIYQNI